MERTGVAHRSWQPDPSVRIESGALQQVTGTETLMATVGFYDVRTTMRALSTGRPLRGACGLRGRSFEAARTVIWRLRYSDGGREVGEPFSPLLRKVLEDGHICSTPFDAACGRRWMRPECVVPHLRATAFRAPLRWTRSLSEIVRDDRCRVLCLCQPGRTAEGPVVEQPLPVARFGRHRGRLPDGVPYVRASSPAFSFSDVSSGVPPR